MVGACAWSGAALQVNSTTHIRGDRERMCSQRMLKDKTLEDAAQSP